MRADDKTTEVEVPEDTGKLMLLLGHARRAPDGVLELTESGTAWLQSWLDRKSCELGQHDWRTVGRAQMCARKGCTTQRLTPREDQS